MLTKETLDSIRTRYEAATPGPWKFVDEKVRVCVAMPFCQGSIALPNSARNDAEFIACARQDIPVLLAEVEELQELADIRLNAAKEGFRLHEDKCSEVLRLKEEVDRLTRERDELKKQCYGWVNAMNGEVE